MCSSRGLTHGLSSRTLDDKGLGLQKSTPAAPFFAIEKRSVCSRLGSRVEQQVSR